MVGVLGGLEAPLQIGKLIAKQPRLLPIAVGSREMQLAMCRSIAVSGLRPVLDRTFALSDLAEAFSYQESGRHFGKIVDDLAVGRAPGPIRAECDESSALCRRCLRCP